MTALPNCVVCGRFVGLDGEHKIVSSMDMGGHYQEDDEFYCAKHKEKK